MSLLWWSRTNAGVLVSSSTVNTCKHSLDTGAQWHVQPWLRRGYAAHRGKSSATSDAGGGNYAFKSHSGSVSEVESWRLMSGCSFELFHVKSLYILALSESLCCIVRFWPKCAALCLCNCGWQWLRDWCLVLGLGLARLWAVKERNFQQTANWNSLSLSHLNWYEAQREHSFGQ